MMNDLDKKWNKLNTDNDNFVTFDELIDNTIGKDEECTIFKL